MRRSIFISLLLVSVCHTASSESRLNETKTQQQNATVKEEKIGTHESQPNSTQKLDAEKAKKSRTIESLVNSQIVSSYTNVSMTNSSPAEIPIIDHVKSTIDYYPITTKASTISSETKSPTTNATIAPVPASTDKSTMPPTPATTNKPTTPDPASKTTTPDPASKTTTPDPASKTTTPDPASNTTTPAPTDKPTTYVPPITSALPSTNAPIVTTTATPAKGRTFDGASFLGGMILSFGMVAIGILGFRYYKSHSEQNYHTL